MYWQSKKYLNNILLNFIYWKSCFRVSEERRSFLCELSFTEQRQKVKRKFCLYIQFSRGVQRSTEKYDTIDELGGISVRSE